MRHLLFLDIDGVLHGDLTPKLSQLDLFTQYLRRLPQVQVVISSTWREDMTLAQLRALFAPDLHARFIDVTPQRPDGYDPGGRAREVADWLASARLHAGNARWVALDDWPHLYDAGCPFLIATDPCYGFSAQDGDALLAWYAAPGTRSPS